MTLALYLGRRYLSAFLRVLAVLSALIFIVQVLENVRGLSKFGISFVQSLTLAAYSAPAFVLETLPVIAMLGALSFCVGLARSNEFVVTRAVGQSALRAILLPAAYALILGLVAIILCNPIAAVLLKQSEGLKNTFTGSAAAVTYSSEGFWLRQKDATGHTVIHAATANRFGTRLTDATVMRFDDRGDMHNRLRARQALLRNGTWIFTDVKSWDIRRNEINPESNAVQMASLRLPTDITSDQILEGYPQPETLALWNLPELIRSIRSAGISTLTHRLHLQQQLALPLMLVAMTVLGAAFTLQNARLGNLGVSVFIAIVCGFSLYFLQNLAMTLGEAGEIPVIVAAWAPPLAALLLAVAVFLVLEDG